MPAQTNKEYLDKVFAILDSSKAQMAADLSSFLRIPSVLDEAEENAPFGAEIAEALKFVVKKAESFGLAAKEDKGCVSVVGLGEGPATVGILCHADVVPAGDHWQYPPFGGEIHGETIYGRGAYDDKGPLIASLYALKAIKEAGVPLKNALQLIVGGDEESGFRCMEYFKANYPLPACAFVPDSEFPLVHAEKGISHFTIRLPLPAPDDPYTGMRLVEVRGGIASNVIPEEAGAFIRCNPAEQDIIADYHRKFEQQRRIILHKTEEGVDLTALGKAAHGSTPEEGINSIAVLLSFLRKLPLAQGAADVARIFFMLCGEDSDGRALRINCKDESGALTMAPTMISFDGSAMSLVVDVRFPCSKRETWLRSRLEKILFPLGVSIEEWHAKDPLFVPKDAPLVKNLMDVYHEITGLEGEPISVGGGTYSRAIPNAVAFGPVFPGEPHLEHQADECITEDRLLELSKIYAAAALRLAEQNW